MHNQLSEKIIDQSSGVCGYKRGWFTQLNLVFFHARLVCSNEENFIKKTNEVVCTIRVFLYISSHLGHTLHFPLRASTRFVRHNIVYNIMLYMLGLMLRYEKWYVRVEWTDKIIV